MRERIYHNGEDRKQFQDWVSRVCERVGWVLMGSIFDLIGAMCQLDVARHPWLGFVLPHVIVVGEGAHVLRTALRLLGDCALGTLKGDIAEQGLTLPRFGSGI